MPWGFPIIFGPSAPETIVTPMPNNNDFSLKHINKKIHLLRIKEIMLFCIDGA